MLLVIIYSLAMVALGLVATVYSVMYGTMFVLCYWKFVALVGIHVLIVMICKRRK